MPAKNSGDLLVIWQLLDSMLREELSMPELAYNLFFGNLHLISLDSQTAVFVCESEGKQDVLKNRYAETLGNTLEKIIGYKPDITIKVDPSLAPELPDDGSVRSPVKIAKENIARREKEPDETSWQDAAEKQPGTNGSGAGTDIPSFEAQKTDVPKTGMPKRLTYNED